MVIRTAVPQYLDKTQFYGLFSLDLNAGRSYNLDEVTD